MNPNFEQVVTMWPAVAFSVGIPSVLALDKVDPLWVSAPDVSLLRRDATTLDRDRGGRLQLNVKGELSVHEKISQRGSSAAARVAASPNQKLALSNSLDDGRVQA